MKRCIGCEAHRNFLMYQFSSNALNLYCDLAYSRDYLNISISVDLFFLIYRKESTGAKRIVFSMVIMIL